MAQRTAKRYTVNAHMRGDNANRSGEVAANVGVPQYQNLCSKSRLCNN